MHLNVTCVYLFVCLWVVAHVGVCVQEWQSNSENSKLCKSQLGVLGEKNLQLYIEGIFH